MTAEELKIQPVPTDELGEAAEAGSVVRNQKADHHDKLHASQASRSESLLSRALRLLFKVVLPVLVLMAAYAGFRYLVSTKPATPQQTRSEQVFAVNTVKAVVGDHQPKLLLYGTTTAGRQVDIRALVSGRVIKTATNLREGGEISKGEVLVEIDPFDFQVSLNEAKAQLAEARARKAEFEASIVSQKSSIEFALEQLALAKKDVDRARPLVRRGALSAQTLEQRQNVVSQRQQTAATLQSDLAVWNARVAQQDAIIERLSWTVKVANRRLTETRLESPFNAYITNITTQVGRTVTANDTVATLIDRDWVEVRFVLTNEQYGRIVSADGSLIGRSVDVVWSLGGTKVSYKADVVQVGAQISSQSGGIELLARVKNPTQSVALRPGAFVEISIADRKFEDVFKLPSAALYNGNSVYAVVDGRLKSYAVTVVGSSGADVLVTSDLPPDSLIITTRLSKPGDGVLVKVAEPQS